MRRDFLTSSSSHHWARKLIALGPDARIIAAQLISPYRQQGAGGNNDANDAAAACEAASRPLMHFVPVKRHRTTEHAVRAPPA
jgi:transposase